jgi:magnesium transporter
MDTPGYPDGLSARGHAVRDVPVADPSATQAEMLDLLTRRPFAASTHVAVCKEGRFLGLIRLERLLPADPGARAVDLMDPDPPRIEGGMDQEMAAWRAVQHGKTALAVVDGDGMFLGLIPPLALLRILRQEHDEDISRLGGYLKSADQARASALENVIRRFGHRLPWILIGLAGAALSAQIVARYEEALRDRVLLAFFIPGIVYLADAVGTQTETVLVRGMSVGVRLGQVVLRELLTGLLIGIVVALAAFLLVSAFTGQSDAALGIGISVLAACSTASATAMILPWILNWTGVDPAYGSGPLATVVQDLLSIAIYFTVATRFV